MKGFTDKPPYKWEKVRVFISSTFRDFHAERDYLIKYVFPELRQWCEKQKLHLIDIDLRWGVTEKEAKSGKVIELCLEQIDGCRPFFICMLGGHRLESKLFWGDLALEACYLALILPGCHLRHSSLEESHLKLLFLSGVHKF